MTTLLEAGPQPFHARLPRVPSRPRQSGKPAPAATRNEQAELIAATARAAKIARKESQSVLSEVRAMIPADEMIAIVNTVKLQAEMVKRLRGLHERQIKSIGSFLKQHAVNVQKKEAQAIITAMSEKDLRELAMKKANRFPSMRDDMILASMSKGKAGLGVVKDLLMKSVFKPRDLPTREQWKLQLLMASKRFSPEAAAAAAVAAMRAGQSPAKARAAAVASLRAFIDTMGQIGESIARKETVETETEAVKEVVKPIQDKVVGYQVLSMLLPTTRDKHRDRHRQIFYLNPGPGQKGMDDCPNPPYESERDKNELAHGCVCRLVAVISDRNKSDKRKG